MHSNEKHGIKHTQKEDEENRKKKKEENEIIMIIMVQSTRIVPILLLGRHGIRREGKTIQTAVAYDSEITSFRKLECVEYGSRDVISSLPTCHRFSENRLWCGSYGKH